MSVLFLYSRSGNVLKSTMFGLDLEICRDLKDDNPLTYTSWVSMLKRCYYTKDSAYQYYGGRGITVCARWMSFQNFCYDVGLRPSKHYTLDRVNPYFNYTLENCRWATSSEQGKNKRYKGKYVYKGVVMSFKDVVEELAQEYQLDFKLLYGRLRHEGVTEYLTRPRSTHNPIRNIELPLNLIEIPEKFLKMVP